jgi:uncharacterized protein YbgA (DUF1722 family)/uncharacterized protein YbbK (DUF523 family)
MDDAIHSRATADRRWRRTDVPIRIGVSGCLLGEEVRFDGGHKRSHFVADELGPFVEWVSVCPEVEAGMQIPRPAIRIVQPTGTSDEADQRLVEVKSGRSHTSAMNRYAKSRIHALAHEDLCGYVLKKDSPSCGMTRVRVWAESGQGGATRDGRGFFARVLEDRMPLLPIEEEGRLEDPALRELFVTRIFAYRRLKLFFDARWTVGELVRFHTEHKMQLLAHSERGYRELGRIVAGASQRPRAEVRNHYSETFMRALATYATRKKHTNVLQHMAGHFRGRLDDECRRELAETIDDHAAGLLPLIVPITLIRHHVRRLGVGYLADQIYLDPHPKELMLRNRI